MQRHPKLQLLFDCAIQGRATDMKALLDNNNKSIFKCPEDDYNPLDNAVINNNLECVKLLVGIYNPQEANNYALDEAACRGYIEITKFLIPLSDPCHFLDIFCDVILKPNNPCFEVLLPHIDPKENNSRALQIASSVENQYYFDVLYPLSDPRIALKSMDMSQYYSEQRKSMLRQRVTSEQEHAEISRHVRCGHKVVVRKM